MTNINEVMDSLALAVETSPEQARFCVINKEDLDALLSYTKQCREALEPFAAFVEFERALQAKNPNFPLRPDDTVFVRWAGAFGSSDIRATYGDLRAARQALSTQPGERE